MDSQTSGASQSSPTPPEPACSDRPDEAPEDSVAPPADPEGDTAAGREEERETQAEQPPEPETAAEETAAEETAAEEEVEQEETVEPLEEVLEEEGAEEAEKDWYILKVQVNREESIRDALLRRVKIAGLESSFGDIIVPTEEVAEFSKSGKRRIVKRKLYPGYIMVNMAIDDDTWFLVRETPGIGDFTGSAGNPTPMAPHEVARILNAGKDVEGGEAPVKTAIPFKAGDRVRVKEGYFQNFEGEIESVDEANGRVTVMINIFGRSTPVELEHWQIESV